MSENKIDLSITVVLGGMMRLKEVRERYLQLFQKSYDRAFSGEGRNAYAGIESVISQCIRADIDVSFDVLMNYLITHYSKLPPNDEAYKLQYALILEELSKDMKYTPKICYRHLEAIAKAKAETKLKSKLLDPSNRGNLQEAIEEFVEEAAKVDSVETGLKVYHPFKDRTKLLRKKTRIPTGVKVIDSILQGGIVPGEHLGILGPSGGGKCWAKNTKMMMYDGTIKYVQDIKVGDQLMGPDSNPRTVLSLARGRAPMYEIQPIKGDSHIVNDAHILCVTPVTNATVMYNGIKYKSGDIIDIPLQEYLNKSNDFKNRTKLRRVAVDFPKIKDPELDPYFVGLYLGDGATNRIACITNNDIEIINYIKDYADKMNWRIREDNTDCPTLHIMSNQHNCKEYPVTIIHRNIKIGNEKRIIAPYKYGSRETRMQVLAGLIDTDGYMHHNHWEICTKFDGLAEDILFVARSLGFAAYDNYCRKTCTNTGASGMYHRITISGDLYKVPVRVERRKCTPRKQIKNVLNIGFKVHELPEDEYYGFTVSGDGRLLLHDFTITHNTILANQLICNFAIRKMDTMIVQFEQAIEGDVAERMFAYLTGRPITDFRDKGMDLPPDVIEDISKVEHIMDHIRCMSYADQDVNITRTGTLDFIKDLQAVYDNGFKFKFLVIDWLGAAVTGFMRASKDKFFETAEIFMDDINKWAKQHGVTVIWMHQTSTDVQNREPAYRPSKEDAYKFKAFCYKTEFCLQLGTPTRRKDGTNVHYLCIGKGRTASLAKDHIVVKMLGAMMRFEEAEPDEFIVNKKGQFVTKAEHLGLDQEDSYEDDVYLPPKNSAEAFVNGYV